MDINERLDVAWKNTFAAQKAEDAARAEWARLELLKVADEHTGISAFAFDISWEYDDEGGYFPVTNIYTTWDHDNDSELDAVEDGMIDISNMLNEGAIAYLGESKTVQELREVRY